MDTEEAVAQRILPLANARPVAELPAVLCIDQDFRITGFNVKDFFLLQGDFFVAGIEGDKLFRWVFPVQPLHQQVVAVC